MNKDGMEQKIILASIELPPIELPPIELPPIELPPIKVKNSRVFIHKLYPKLNSESGPSAI